MHENDAIERLHKVAESRLGRTLAGRFTLDRIIAIGGMATVYEATQAPLMRQVAVKVLHPTEIEAGRTDFFLREANAASALRHPNIIAIVDFGQEDDGTLFLAMEFVPGIDLGDLLSTAFPLPVARLISIAEQVCLALEVAHRAGVVHCDMKPSNVMVESVPGNPDFVKVVDFGISRIANPEVEEEAPEEILGSAHYMAPEQALGRQVLPETDIYGLGAVLYAALTGNVPFAGVEETNLLDHIVQTMPPPPSIVRPDLTIPTVLDGIVLRAMNKRPDERFRSAAEMRLALLSLVETRRTATVSADSLDILLDEELFDVDADLGDLVDLGLEDASDWGPIGDLPDSFEPDITGLPLEGLDLSRPRPVSASDTLDPPAFQRPRPTPPGAPPAGVGPPPPPAPVREDSPPTDMGLSGLPFGTWHEDDHVVDVEFDLDPNPIDLDDEEPIELTEPAPTFGLARQDTAALRRDPPRPRQTGSMTSIGRGRSASLIGRQDAFDRLMDEFDRTRRGAVSVLVSGDYGSGRSFFLDHVVRSLQLQSDAVVLSAELHPGDRERPYIALVQWIKAALACTRARTTMFPAGSDFEQDVFTSAPVDPLSPERRPPTPMHSSPAASPTTSDLAQSLRTALNDLQLGPLEKEALTSLLTRWTQHRSPSANPWYDEPRCFDGSALRLPETRRQLLRYAFDGLVRRLVQLNDLQRGEGNPSTVVLVIDGWEHCDHVTRDIVQNLLREGRSLPLLLLATLERVPLRTDETFPEEADDDELDDETREWDTEIRIGPLSTDDLADFLAQRYDEPISEPAIRKLHHLSGGNPLYLKELLFHATQTSALSVDARIRALPDELGQVIGAQIDGLSRQGKMLLAVCAVLGYSFPHASLRGTLPDDFDLDGALAELIGFHILEPGPNPDEQHIFFRLPLLRDTAMRRMNPQRQDALHRRFATVLKATHLPIPRSEAELWLAIHCVKSGDPIGGIDHLLDVADMAIERGEPELALRRFRQARLWTGRKLARLLGNEEQLQSLIFTTEQEVGLGDDLHRQLQVRAVSATMGLFKAARKLGYRPGREHDAIIPERLPTRFLDQLKDEYAEALPPRLAAEAAIEVGRYLMGAELLQAARTALQAGLAYARMDGEVHLVVTAEVHLATCLHQLGKAGLAADLATECYTRLKGLGPPPPLSEPTQQLRATVPLTLLGEICIDRGKYTLADEYLTQARRMAEADGDIDRLHELHSLRARLAHLQNRPAETVLALETAREVANRAHDLRAQARVLYNLGVTLAMNGHGRRAEQQLRLAAFIAQALAWKEFIALVDEQLRNLK